MSFLYPNMLFLLPLILILFGFLITQKESQATFFSDAVMEKLRVHSGALSLKVRNVLFLFIFILIVLALANPVIKEGKVAVKAKSADIMLALDISDSMLATDIYPNRLNAAKQKAMDLLKLAPNERLGVIAFAKNSYLVSPLSFDHNAVGFLLRQLDTTSITEKGTDLLSMLEVVDKSIQKESQKYLLIFSDGGDSNDFDKEIAFAKEKNITVFVLGMGTPKGAPIKRKDGEFIKQNGEIIVSKLNENIASLATATGGVYIENVRADEDVKTMLQEIEKHSVKRELKSEEVEKFIPLFYYPLALALLLLLIATSSTFKRGAKLFIIVFFVGLSMQTQNLYAGLLDFQDLDAAKRAYEAKEYENASKLYKNYAKQSEHTESYYNAGNALYKEQKYADAINSYEKASFQEKEKEAHKFANIGNAYVKQAKPELLKKAVGAYEKSLKLKEDKQTRENLEAVKKYIKEQKQKQKQQNKKKNQDSKEKRDKNKSDKKNESKEKKKSQQNRDSNKKSEDKKESEKEKKNSQKQDKKDTKSKQEKKQTQAKKEQQKKKEKLKELGEDKKNKKGEEKTPLSSKKSMSNEEEKKWLKKLNNQPTTYLYQLNQNSKKEEDLSAKPW